METEFLINFGNLLLGFGKLLVKHPVVTAFAIIILLIIATVIDFLITLNAEIDYEDAIALEELEDTKARGIIECQQKE